MENLHDKVERLLKSGNGLAQKTASINARVNDVDAFEKLASALDAVANHLDPSSYGRIPSLAKSAAAPHESKPIHGLLENTLTTPVTGTQATNTFTEGAIKKEPLLIRDLAKATPAQAPTLVNNTLGDGVLKEKQPQILSKSAAASRLAELLKRANANDTYGQNGYFASAPDAHVLPIGGRGSEFKKHIASNAAAEHVPQRAAQAIATNDTKLISPEMTAAMIADKKKILEANLPKESINSSLDAKTAAKKALLMKLASTEEGKQIIRQKLNQAAYLEQDLSNS